MNVCRIDKSPQVYVWSKHAIQWPQCVRMCAVALCSGHPLALPSKRTIPVLCTSMETTTLLHGTYLTEFEMLEVYGVYGHLFGRTSSNRPLIARI